MGFKIFLYDEEATINRVCKNDVVGKFMAETCARYMDKFVPMDTGALAQNYLTEPFKVIYTQPYAHYQYNGDGFNFKLDKHPNATSHWDSPTSLMHTVDIANELTAFIRSR